MPRAESTTRRTVVKTGAKIVYAAPFVAASMTLSEEAGRAGAAISGPTCVPAFEPCDPNKAPILCCSGTCAFIDQDLLDGVCT